ncbi:hypothetical protein F5Y11DRAFT_366300 [Daldinia sp. FL1419]|nr:hypothetical protein F5Y11DRAFT_366300 [Daldinia sp. FL1419]
MRWGFAFWLVHVILLGNLPFVRISQREASPFPQLLAASALRSTAAAAAATAANGNGLWRNMARRGSAAAEDAGQRAWAGSGRVPGWVLGVAAKCMYLGWRKRLTEWFRWRGVYGILNNSKSTWGTEGSRRRTWLPTVIGASRGEVKHQDTRREE